MDECFDITYRLEKKIAYNYLDVIILRKTSGILSLKIFASAQPPPVIRKHFVMPTDCRKFVKKNIIDVKKEKNPF